MCNRPLVMDWRQENVQIALRSEAYVSRHVRLILTTPQLNMEMVGAHVGVQILPVDGILIQRAPESCLW